MKLMGPLGVSTNFGLDSKFLDDTFYINLEL